MNRKLDYFQSEKSPATSRTYWPFGFTFKLFGSFVALDAFLAISAVEGSGYWPSLVIAMLPVINAALFIVAIICFPRVWDEHDRKVIVAYGMLTVIVPLLGWTLSAAVIASKK